MEVVRWRQMISSILIEILRILFLCKGEDGNVMMPPGAIAMLTVKFRSKNRIRFLCGSGLYVMVSVRWKGLFALGCCPGSLFIWLLAGHRITFPPLLFYLLLLLQPKDCRGREVVWPSRASQSSQGNGKEKRHVACLPLSPSGSRGGVAEEGCFQHSFSQLSRNVD